MCELFALSSLHPASASFSLDEFARHGGISGPHKDGWGIAFYEEKDARLIRDVASAGESPYLEFIRNNRQTSQIILAHIRLATQGERSLHNCQPFSRELGGRVHLFAHNGDLAEINSAEFPLGRFHPIGDTDSEYAFCHLMSMLEGLWLTGHPPSLQDRYQIIREFAARIQPLGPANFIYSDGEYLFAHGHKRTQPGREGHHPPGLHYLQRTCTIPQPDNKFSGVNLNYGSKPQEVTLLASVPLSDEGWRPLSEGEILVLSRGTVLRPG
ncbi:MAG: class II glutamine amidotransferase [Sedimenticola sp.]|jgi:glutamine amidotransferase|nr:MAG: class II glutamine amidotransferase [Sedimenticola sp.]